MAFAVGCVGLIARRKLCQADYRQLSLMIRHPPNETNATRFNKVRRSIMPITSDSRVVSMPPRWPKAKDGQQERS
jgi:hypothetical protein